MSDTDIYTTDVTVALNIPRRDVEDQDTATTILVLKGFLSTQQRLMNGRQRLVLGFDGYDDDPRDVYDIPAVREFVQAVDRAFPYLFYFADPDYPTLRVLALCLCRVAKSNGMSAPELDDFRAFLEGHILALNRLCDDFGLGDDVKLQITDSVLAQLTPRRP